MLYRITILILLLVVLALWAHNHILNGGFFHITVTYHSHTWNILPYIEADFPSDDCPGWCVTFGWLCVSVEISTCDD